MPVILRDMQERDIETYVRWMTVSDDNIDWNLTDSPWENIDTDEETERLEWRKYYDYIRALPADHIRWKQEIEADGEHIGWVTAYDDLGYIDNPDGIPAIGIDIAERRHRGKGYGRKALRLWMDYLKSKGFKSLFTQTWSGNAPMLALAEKLGFREFYRAEGIREVDGKKYDALTLRIDF